MDPQMANAPAHGCLDLVPSEGSRVPPHRQEKGAQGQHLGMPLAALQRSCLGAKPNDDDAPRYHALSLSQSSLRSASSQCFSPSPSSTPTNYSFGPLSPNSLASGFQSPPSIAGMSFCHSREPSLDDALPIGALKKQDLFSSLRAITNRRKGHRYGVASADSSIRHRHRPVQSIDWIEWRPATEDDSDDASSPGLKQEEDDLDLIAYRSEAGARVTVRNEADAPSSIQHSASEPCPPTPNLSRDEHHEVSAPPTPHTPSRETPVSTSSGESYDTPSPCSDAPSPTPTNPEDGDDVIDRADQVARIILKEGFNLRLGYSEPPTGVVDAVRDCLEDISLSLQRARGMGFVSAAASSESPASSAATPSSGTLSRNQSKANRKRTSRNRSDRDGDLHEESDEEGEAEAGGQTEPANRKKPKLDQYPCPFRKRNPLRFNCREWEYCAKAPFKSMTDLKKHIIKYHYQQELAFKCIRCRERFARMEDLESHMLVDAADICERRSGDADQRDEETINDAVVERLKSRTEQFDWKRLWETLFPRDTKAPAPEYEPVVEHHEVNQSYHRSWPIFQEKLALTLETLLSVRGGLSNREQLQCRLIMGSTLENIVQEFVGSFFEDSRAVASKPFEPGPVKDTTTAEVRTARPAARAPSLSSTRPTSLASSSSRSGPRSIRPNIVSRGSDWSSFHSSASSPSSSARQSAMSLGTNYRTSFTDSVPGFHHAAPAQSATVTLPSRPLQTAAAVHLPKRRTHLREDGAGNPRDSAITDMGCPNCLLGLACQCASPYFDMQAYMDNIPAPPDTFPSLENHMGDIPFFAGEDMDPNTAAATNSGTWNIQHFSG
ncbi:hypothetical protein B0T14DRAFT_570794 [Immersiella caudata]|uniref:C2H2-type domain-containing protein n=1 Tax=Immersiella caudata TaxID=314043 RepID=A0AA39TS39_9PEZI|nr:hypothetical protein B0T14DRAFT_570794 [Immersiella caudata]